MGLLRKVKLSVCAEALRSWDARSDTSSGMDEVLHETLRAPAAVLTARITIAPAFDGRGGSDEGVRSD